MILLSIQKKCQLLVKFYCERLVKYMLNWFKSKSEIYVEQLAGYEFNQLELEYTYKKSGGKNNTIISGNNVVRIVFENDNPHDCNAVAVYAYNLKIGYIPAYDAPTVRKMIKPVVSLRLYYYNNKYRAEITIEYKGLKK